MISLKSKYIAIRFLLIAFIAVLILSSCDFRDKVKIALTKGKGSEHYLKYEQWLKQFDEDIEFIDLYHVDKEEAIKILKECSGIVLTGGPDVDPMNYGKAADSSRCEIDLKRDSLEFEAIKVAYEMKLPMLAICRGEQILNVAFGGSLIVDIPSDFDTTIVHRCADPADCYHDVYVIPNSLLSQITKVSQAEVNTNHHQAVDNLASVFIASAFSKDGLIEAYEWRERESKPFLIAVQWHPERLNNSKLSDPIGRRYISEVNKFYNLGKQK
jgi:putative glutamine amidotransferase